MVAKIELRNMRFHAAHGAMPQERLVGNDFIVNICLQADIASAAESDVLESTINYAEVFNVVDKEMKSPSLLLENVALRILNSLKQHFPSITQTEVSVAKLNPPIEGAEIESAAILLIKSYVSEL